MNAPAIERPGVEPAAPAVHPAGRWRRLDSLVLAGYLAVVGVRLWLHPMWRDELQSWDLARSSRSFSQLLSRVRYEQHPPLWYVLLWGWSQFGSSPRLLQLLTLLLVAATAAVVLRFCPWPRPLRWLLLAGYFPLFEWSTMSRPYLLTFGAGIVGAELVRRRRTGLPLGAVCAVLILTDDAYGTVIATALLCCVVWRAPRPGWARCRVAAAAAAAAAVAAIASDLPPRGYGGPTLGVTAASVRAALRAPLHALVPIPDVDVRFWNTNVFDVAGTAAVAAAGVALAWWVGRRLRGDRGAVVLWAAGVVGTVGVQVVTGLPYDRFVDTIVVALVCAFWVHPAFAPASSPGEVVLGDGVRHGPPDVRRVTAALTALLALQVPGALIAVTETAVNPFSQAAAAAATVRRLPGTVIAVPDETAVPVAAYAHRPLDLLDGPTTATYVTWDQDRLCADRWCNHTQLLEAALYEAGADAVSGPVYLLTDWALPPGTNGLQLVRSWRGAVVEDEDYWLYLYLP